MRKNLVKNKVKLISASAGFPSPAENYVEEKLNLNSYLIKNKESSFFVRVSGDSMINVGINEGDIAIIKQKDTAYDGDLVVALIDNSESTLKRYKKKGTQIILESANENYKPQIYDSGSNIKIQGILSGLIRKYNS